MAMARLWFVIAPRSLPHWPASLQLNASYKTGLTHSFLKEIVTGKLRAWLHVSNGVDPDRSTGAKN